MKEFDAARVKQQCVKWIQNWFANNGPKCNAIVGISGGKDSSVVAALCVEALGRERVIGVLMPNGLQDDIIYAFRLIDFLGIREYKVNIEPICRETLTEIGHYEDIKISEQTKINLPARIRMTMLYAISQSENGRVANTCNLSEDYVGYATRYGDSVGDFSPLSRLTTDEVIAIGKECGLPDQLLYKEPADGLCGKTDEENLGFSYATLNRYIRTGVCDDPDVKARIDNLHEKNLFKMGLMQSFMYYPPEELAW